MICFVNATVSIFTNFSKFPVVFSAIVFSTSVAIRVSFVFAKEALVASFSFFERVQKYILK